MLIEDGLSLSEANALALFYSPTLRMARSDARMAGAQVLQAGLLQNPQLFLGPRISTRDAQVIFPVSLSWQVPLWGRREARRDAAEALLSVEGQQLIALEFDTLQKVQASFLRLTRLRAEQEVLEGVASSSREILSWVDGLRAVGEVDSTTVFLARIQRDDVQAALRELQNQAARERSRLLEMLGLLPEAPVEFLLESNASLPVLPESDRSTLLRLPELRAAEASYAAAEARLRLEIRKQYPAIQLGLEFESDRGDRMLGPGLGFSLPIFDRNQGNIAAAEDARTRARESYEGLLLGAAHREARARQELSAAEQVLQVYREGALQEVEDALRSLAIRLRAGRADVIEVLTAQQAIGRARARMLQLEEEVAVAKLRAAVAGGLALQDPGASDEEAER